MKPSTVAFAFAIAALCAGRLDAHKPVTSKYTFSDDVYPIFKEQCGGCHVPGGNAPMSLMTYEDARPWAESIRLELTTGHMPPWYGDPGVAPLRDVHRLSPRDLDVVLTWATGGTPSGPPLQASPTRSKPTWQSRRPDLVLQMPTAVTLPADATEDTREIVLRDDNDQDRSIAFVDLLPGNASIVHDAMIFARKPGSSQPSTVFTMWLPGAAPVGPPPGFAFRWRPHEQLVARIHYKKNWRLENKAASDRSTIGVYLTRQPSREIRGLPIGRSDELTEDVRAIAVRVARTKGEAPVRIEAIRPGGMRLTIAGFLARAGWDERYWLARPVDLPKGTRLAVSPADETNVHIWLDVSPM